MCAQLIQPTTVLAKDSHGFAVVATEVRNLVQRSSSAAKEIKSLINDSVGQVEDGSQLVDQAGTTMSQILDSVKKVALIMRDIATASQEQSTGIQEINRAVSMTDDGTQQNAALVEQAAAAAQSLQDQANALSKVVGQFKL